MGTWGAGGAYSFYPTKNLGALGDGGAVVTNDAALAARIKRLRNGGQTDRYHHAEFGLNTRLDEMQAAILRARLPRLAGWTAARRRLAARYRERLATSAITVPPACDPGHVYHLFPVLSPSREAIREALTARGIDTLIHYPVALPRQAALASTHPAECPIAARVSDEVFSLPLHPALPEAHVDLVAEALTAIAPR